MQLKKRIVALACFLVFLLVNFNHIALNVAGLTRPVWEKPPKEFQIITHYHAPNVSMDILCKRHGWVTIPKKRVVDAILFSVELDLLEIRLRELLDHVDLFLIIESNSTFTGRSKPFVFAQNRDRFAFAAHKIVHKQFSLPFLNQNDEQSYFEVERLHRDQMQKLLVDQNLNTGDRIIFADLDEIPAGHTIDLIKSCSSPPRIHLQLRNYLFSFEFHIDNQSWRAQIATWPAVYSHSRATDLMLADAGWHCSYCFRTLDDFRFKMLGFSHADRVHYNSLLSDESIQSRICQGKDPFDMIPEAHSFSDLFRKMNPVKSKSAVGLPSWLVQNAEKFRFLLPGGCKRT